MGGANLFPQLNFEAVIVLVAAAFASVLLILTPLFLPFRLLFTMIHELGHVFAMILSGGEVEGFWVYFKSKDGKRGEASGSGDPRLVNPAGYLGLTLFSAGLILLSGLPYITPYILTILGGILILTVLIYGRSFSTRLMGLIFGAGFIWVAWNAHLMWSVFLLNLVAILAGFTALSSLRELAQVVRTNPGEDDASKMADLIGCSPMFWVNVWFLLSILILGLAFWFTWLRNLSG